MSLPPAATLTHDDLQATPQSFAILPIGSYASHGAHLPMATETLIAGSLAQRLQTACGGMLLPPLPVSCSQDYAGFHGTVWLGAETLARIIGDIVAALAHSGIHRLVIVNANQNNAVLHNIALELNVKKPCVYILPTWQNWLRAATDAGIETPQKEDAQAGEIETSLMLADYPDLVKAPPYHDHAAAERPWLHVDGMKRYSPFGIVGAPSKASAEKGQRLFEHLTAAMVRDMTSVLELKPKKA
jgi:creatinine amidohydrolase